MAVFFSVHRRFATENAAVHTKEKLFSLFQYLRPDVLEEKDYYIHQEGVSSLLVFSVHPGIKIRGGNLCSGLWNKASDNLWEDVEMPASASFWLRNNHSGVSAAVNQVGGRSVWYYIDQEQLLISSSQRAILAWLGSLDFNPQAVSWMLATGNLGPGNSWDRRIKHLEAGEQVSLQFADWNFSSGRIKPANYHGMGKLSDELLTERLKDTLQNVFGQTSLPGVPSSTVLSLSGGYDSRTVLMNLLAADCRIDTISWGLRHALTEQETDAAVTKQIAQKLDIKNTYFDTDFTGYSFDTLFNRFLSFGEGRLDHVNSFMDGFSMWEKLYESGVRNIIRADEVFGWLPCRSEQDVRISLDFNFSEDNSNVPAMDWFDLEEQVVPERYQRKEKERLEDWRDRLYRSFRVPYVLTALHDLIHPFMEVINPLLHRDIIRYATSLPAEYRTNKILYARYVLSLLPDIPVAKKPSVPEPAAILKSGVIVDYMREELSSGASMNILGNRFIKWSTGKLTTDNSIANITNSNFDLWIKQHTPWQLKKLLRKYFLKYRADYNQIAFRGLIITRMHRLLLEDIKALKPEAVYHPEKEKQPMFSVVIPTYNRGDMIHQPLNSVTRQRYPGYEAIIVDDGSTDDTAEKIKPYLDNRKIKYHKTLNRERGAARNAGTSMAEGDYICFLDSDDFLLPYHLQYAAEVIKNNPGIPVFHLNYEFQDETGQVIRKNPVDAEIVNDYLIKANVLSCNGVFIRKDVALSHPFSELRDLSGTEDYELWLRIAAEFPIRHFPQVTSVIIDHQGRSMADLNTDKTLKRINTFVSLVDSNEQVRQFIGNRKKQFVSYCYSYIALSMVLAGKNMKSLKYFIRSLLQYPMSIKERRSMAIFKHLLKNIGNGRWT